MEGVQASVEAFVPPPPIPGCQQTCLVCHPVATTEDISARFAEQGRSPFVRFRCVPLSTRA